MKDPLNRSLELLAGVTPGPWEANGTGAYVAMMSIIDDKIRKYVSAPQAGICLSDGDIAFIAESPALVAALCKELKLAREVIETIAPLCDEWRQQPVFDDDVYRMRQRSVDALSAYQALIAKRGGEKL